MKVITNDAIYVQMNDLAYLMTSDTPIPASIMMKVFGRGMVIINDDNRYDFVRFTEDDEIEFFKDLDWIVDYDELKDKSDEELLKFGKSVAENRDSIATLYNKMSLEDRKQHPEMVEQCDLLEFKMYSIRDFLWYKQGHITMHLPIENTMKKEEPPKKKAGIKELIKRFFINN